MNIEDRKKQSSTKLTVGLTVVKYCGKAYLPFLQRRYRHRKNLPSVENPLLLLSATDLANAIRSREISSVVVVQAYIDRIRAVNPILNAVIEDRFDAALDDALKADKLCNELSVDELREKYPLLGVPFTVKESVGVEGMSQHVGVVARKGMKCEKEGPLMRNLRQAGAIPLCVTNIPEWCCNWETHNVIQGRTFNPYNTSYTPGGSSGGEAALLGAAASLFGVGTDFMGSIRLPAMFCGVFGHRPTRPLVSLEKSVPDWPDPTIQKIMATGPMCRYAKDLPLLLKIMIGENVELAKLDEVVDLKSVKILMPTTFANSIEDTPVDKEIVEKLNLAAEELKKLGCKVERIEIDYNGLFERLLSKYLSADLKEVIDNMTDIPKRDGCNLPFLREYLKWGMGKSTHNIYAIHAQLLIRFNRYYPTHQNVPLIDAFEKQMKNILQNDSVLLFPTFPTAAFKHHGFVKSIPAMVYILLASVFNLPATSIPMGLNKEQMPIGIQVIGGPFQDRLCLSVAQFLETKFGGWVPPPSE
ncbi:fatty-acid amide hydrolase 2-B-like [Culicoides brevitarsis]|uniref:fatty-acid amide hydrolase 2-B-like n=1 Tax=Culicoides brevitarsis TaxID=469753 RepID=UPI00307BB56F